MQMSIFDKKHYNNINVFSHGFAIIVLIRTLHILTHLIISEFRVGPFRADCILGETDIQVFQNLLPVIQPRQKQQLNPAMVLVLRDKMKRSSFKDLYR